jgi:NTE family protein
MIKVGLALSGGGAKGFAHVGVIRCLQKLGVKPYCISGASMGALIGGWYAANKDFAILEGLARTKQWKQFLPIKEIFNAVRTGGGLFTLNSFQNFLKKEIGDLAIENLSLPYCAIATSLKTGKEVRLQTGSLAKAILASGCIPVIFAPVERDQDLLVDGGITNNLPIQACFDMGAEMVIAVDVRYIPGDIEYVLNEEHHILHWKIFRVLSYLMDMVHPQEQSYPAEKTIILKPYISHIGTFDFDRVSEIINLGAEAFSDKEEEIMSTLGLPQKPKTFWDKLFE